ncbi:MAG: hypothetical protein J1E00_04065 [Oscillospiraceae bacterium]|nr:hypothetical protein [Oscillospiraceae bacterium]
MGKEQNANQLFPPIEPQDDVISIEDDTDSLPPKKRKFGRWIQIVLICLFVSTILLAVFLFLSTLRRDDGAPDASSVPVQSEETSEQSEQTEEVSEETSEEVTSEVSEPQAEDDSHGWIINSMGYTYLYHGVGVEQFNYSAATLERYLESIRSLAAMVPEGTSVYCMPVPTRIGFLYAEIDDEVKREDDFFNSWQETFLNTVEDNLRPQVSVVNLYESFSEAYQAGEELFFRTDKNWTSDAAYLAYQRYCYASGILPAALSDYDEKRIEGFLGSFYLATGAEQLRNHADLFRYYQNEHTVASKVILYSGGSVYKSYCLAGNAVSGVSSAYSVYLGTEGARFQIESPCTTGRKLLVVGDGSAAAMLPFLIENYSEIQYVNVVSYRDDFSDLFSSNTFHDVLFVSYVTNTVKGEYPQHLAAMAGILQEDEQTNG